MNSNLSYYFPGGNTVNGFFSYYNEILDHNILNKIYTIKGGPGVGKSTLMKEIGKNFEKENYHIDYFHCSSDPDSLDGVLVKEKGVLFVDGTAPHIIDLVYPGAVYELINLAEFLNFKQLEEKKESVINLTNNISSTFKRAYKYLAALSPVYEDLNNIYEKSINKKEFFKITELLDKLIISEKKGNGFKEKKLFLSAITPKGFKNFIDRTIKCRNIYVLNSHTGDLTYKLLNKLRDKLENNEFNIECYFCPMGPDKKIENIIIPELNTAIVTSNKYHTCYKGEKIDISNLYNVSPEYENEIKYNQNLIDELLKHSIGILKSAKETHDILEDYYKDAMDYEKLNNYSKQIIKSISR